MAHDVKVTQTFSGVGNSEELQIRSDDRVGLSLSGTFVGTVIWQRSFDEGVTWNTLSDAAGNTNFTAPVELQYVADAPCLLRARCSAYTSGSPAVTLIRTHGSR